MKRSNDDDMSLNVNFIFFSPRAYSDRDGASSDLGGRHTKAYDAYAVRPSPLQGYENISMTHFI
jgi:hypothetical protein